MFVQGDIYADENVSVLDGGRPKLPPRSCTLLTSAFTHSLHAGKFYFRPIFFHHERSEKDAAIHVAMMAGVAAAKVARRSRALLFFKKFQKLSEYVEFLHHFHFFRVQTRVQFVSMTPFSKRYR